MSRLLEKKIKESQNSCLIAYKDDILNDILGQYEEVGGQNWWHLVVDWGDGKYRVIKFEDLIPQLENAPKFSVLESIKYFNLPAAESIDKDEMGLTATINLARKQRSSLLVITENKNPIGILYVSSRLSIKFSFDIGAKFRIKLDITTGNNFVTSNDEGNTRFDLSKIFHYLNKKYSLEELRNFSYFNIGIELDDLAGDGKESKIRALCSYAQRHGKLSLLVEKLEQDRPGVKF